jgi:hypothetical protein
MSVWPTVTDSLYVYKQMFFVINQWFTSKVVHILQVLLDITVVLFISVYENWYQVKSRHQTNTDILLHNYFKYIIELHNYA